MVTRVGSASGIIQRGPTLSDINFDITAVDRDTVVTPGSSTSGVVNDLYVLYQTTATVDNEYDLILSNMSGDYFEIVPTYESLDESIATVTQYGQVERVADGTVGILARTRLLTKRVDLAISRTGGTSTSGLIQYVDGSLAKDCSDAIDDRISGLSASTTINLFSTQDHVDSNYVRNASFWASDVDLTCISPWNSGGGNKRAGTLISPRHIIFAEHYQLNVGNTVRFVKSDNTVVDRVLTAKQSVGPSNASDGYATDLTVGLLDSDVPAGISYAPVLPSGYSAYLPSLSADYALPALCLDQDEKGLVTDLYLLSTSASLKVSTDDKRLEYYEPKISGDSGNPVFLIINDELVLVTCLTFGGAGAGSNIANLHSEINSAMTSLGGGYTLTTIDLSGFASYS